MGDYIIVWQNGSSVSIKSLWHIDDIDSGNGLVPLRCQAITWNNIDLLTIRSQGKCFNEKLSESEKKNDLREIIWKCRLQKMIWFG